MLGGIPSKTTWVQRLNYTRKYVKILRIFRGSGLKILTLLALPIYWAIIILVTFSL
tara:strand:- start:276 stop:443 length:168 start_codon:yes stop_codon:yes gene_type:complete